ncbi:MAG: CARDB domain-containing protein [bacterium]
MRYKYIIIPLFTMLISSCAGQLPNLLIKDSSIDNGVSTSQDRSFWLSPDIWLDNNDDGRPDEFPVPGKPNKLFARVHNIGTSKVENIKVKFYANKANTYFPFEEKFLIGTNVIPEIVAGESVITSVIWDNVKETDFWSFGVAVDSKEDPIASNDPLEESNLAYRSFWNVYTYPGIPVVLKFRVQNPFTERNEVNLTLEAQGLPNDWQAYLGKSSFNLLAKEFQPVLLMVTPALNTKNEEGVVNVISRIEGKIIGGISYRIMVK